MLIGCILLAMACSNDNDELNEGLLNTRETDSGTNAQGSDDANTDGQYDGNPSGDQEILPPDEIGANPVVIFYSIEEKDT